MKPYSISSTPPIAKRYSPGYPSVIRMRLDGANSAPPYSGTAPLPGKSNYFIGSDPSKWHRDIPQFGGVEYQASIPASTWSTTEISDSSNTISALLPAPIPTRSL